MTDAERIACEMEFGGDNTRLKLAGEVLHYRALLAACTRYRLKLPHQVQTALRVPPADSERDAPPLAGTHARLV